MKLSVINHNSNIIESIINLIYTKLEFTIKEDKDDIYLKSNKIKEWLNNNGIPFKGQIPPSASGSQGTVYFFKDKVLKISRDEVEAKIASELKGDPVVAAIDVIKLDDGVYGILQKAVKFNKKDPRVAGFDYLMAYFDNHGTEVIHQNTEELKNAIVNEFNCEDVDLETAINTIKYIYSKTGYIHDDASPGNVGIFNGNIVLTDLGPDIIAS